MWIKKKTGDKRTKRIVRHVRSRKKISGTAEKPRLSIFRGSTALYAQAVDDGAGKTLLGMSTASKAVDIKGKSIESAKKLGKAFGEKCREKNIEKVVFDRGGYKYHGVIKAFAEAARESGLKF